MNRLFRATFLPLLALAGLALLASGVVSWWSFHRALFVEELAAIEALAGTDGVVEFRRQGEPAPREFDARKPFREAVPWSVPFAGRVELVKGTRRGFDDLPPKAIRDRLLRLPGLRGYLDAEVSYEYGWFPEIEQPAEDLPVGRPLPELPRATLTFENLSEPFPEGEALPADEARALARQIETAWREETSDRPRLERLERTSGSRKSGYEQKSWRLVLDEGPRRIEFGSSGVPRRLHWGSAHLFLRTQEALYAAKSVPDGWRFDAVCDADLPEAKRRDLPEAHQPQLEDPAWFASDPHEFSIFYFRGRAVELLGPDAANVERIERLDDDRLRLRTRPWQDPEDVDLTVRLDVIVRRDLDFGIERFQAIADQGSPWTTYAGVQRLARSGGETVVTETLRTDWFAQEPEASDAGIVSIDGFERERIATEFDPVYSASVFDPRKYEPGLPPRRDLPVVRPYRVAAATGAICLLLATCGWIVGSLQRRPVPEPVGERTTRKRFSLQFGFATLFGIALLVISLAGWVKSHIEEAQEQTALLAALTEEGARLRVGRHPPGLPWMFFSTGALPLDAPLLSVTSDEAPPPAALDRLLRLSPAVAYVCEAPEREELPEENPRAEDFDRQRAALQDAEAQAGDVDWPAEPIDPFETSDLPFPSLRGMQRETDPLDRFPKGDPYSDASQAAVIGEAIRAWRKAGASTLDPYAVLEEAHWDSDSDARMTIRDGARFRSGATEHGVDWIECQDEYFRRRFAWTAEEGWRLVLRRPLGAGEETVPVVTLRSAKEEGERLLRTADPPPEEPPSVPYGRPVPAAGLPRAPYCLPPCLGSWAPPLNEALLRIEAEDVVSVKAIDPDRIRFDLLYPYSKMGDVPAPLHDEATADHPWVADWSIVVRTDLDWAVERCEYIDEFVREAPVTTEVTTPSVYGFTDRRVVATGAMRPARRRREVKIVNEFDSDDAAAPYVGTLFDCKELEEGAYASGISGRVFYAVDLSPEFPGPVFDRATVDSPDPPLPEKESKLPWYLVTGTLACAGLVILGARRTLASPRGGEKRAD
ncbi:MAG TPA: hypothetical protein VGN57_16890 [Pirellulaceae bacterium]|jgi:hypothetical protein|nr:hypothetical protein [Pirellulaceae bacterium]